MITDVDVYFDQGCGRCARFATDDCSVRLWADGLATLRTICLDLGLQETVKWGHPCYVHAGRNIAVFGAFRETFRLSLMNSRLLKDADQLLEKNGPNTEARSVVSFRSTQDISAKMPVIRAYLRELMDYAEAGIKPPPQQRTDRALADELVDAMDADPAFAAAFEALTPGRQRGWNLHFSTAKQAATRTNRIMKARDKIFAGKGWNER